MTDERIKNVALGTAGLFIPKPSGTFPPLDIGGALRLAPAPGAGKYLIAIDDDAIDRAEMENFYFFVSRAEVVDVTKYKKFHTLTERELDEIIGHPVMTAPDGKPILSNEERKVFAAAILLRHRVTGNPDLSRKDKLRIIDSLRDGDADAKLRAETMIGGGMVPPAIQDQQQADDIDLDREFRVTDLRPHDDTSQLPFDQRLATVELAKIEKLIGRKLGRTEDGKYHDVTDVESRFLGNAMAGLDAMVRAREHVRQRDVISRVIARTKREFGDAPAARLLAFLRAESFADAQKAKKQIRELDDELIDLHRQDAALKEMADWLHVEPMLQRPDGSALHKLREACHARDILALFVKDKMPPFLKDALDDIEHSFVIEHNWASAFAGATDFEGGEVHLPYPVMAMEFQVSGKRIVVVLQEDERGTIALPYIKLNAGWCLVETFIYKSGAMTPNTLVKFPEGAAVVRTMIKLIDLIGSNIRAVSISLEAEVAETMIVRVPHLLNRAREKRGKLPLSDYHVVSLARRTRYLPRGEPLDPDREITRKRLHFRRGHTRHYPTFKIWIKWQLIGDPDLGFVDKHYKL